MADLVKSITDPIVKPTERFLGEHKYIKYAVMAALLFFVAIQVSSLAVSVQNYMALKQAQLQMKSGTGPSGDLLVGTAQSISINNSLTSLAWEIGFLSLGLLAIIVFMVGIYKIEQRFKFGDFLDTQARRF